METYLLVEDQIEVIEETEPAKLEDNNSVFFLHEKEGIDSKYKAWRKKNVKALYAIQKKCGPEMFCYIREIKTAKGAWETLEKECRVVLEGTFFADYSKYLF